MCHLPLSNGKRWRVRLRVRLRVARRAGGRLLTSGTASHPLPPQAEEEECLSSPSCDQVGLHIPSLFLLGESLLASSSNCMDNSSSLRQQHPEGLRVPHGGRQKGTCQQVSAEQSTGWESGPRGICVAFVGGPRDYWCPLPLSGQSWKGCLCALCGLALHNERTSCSKNARRAPLRNR